MLARSLALCRSKKPEKKQPPVCEPKGVPEEPDSFQSALESPPDETLIPENILPPQCTGRPAAAFREPCGAGGPAWDPIRLLDQNVKEDYSNFYSCTSLLEFASGLGPAATMANTTIDDKFRFWYQTRVRSSASDQIARVAKNFGEGLYVVPACAAMDVVGNCLADCPLLGPVGDFGDRTVRAYLVGAPPVLLMQGLLGSGRPSDTADNSYWHPFKNDNGVSGHAFVGAVPFITAAQMSDNIWEKGFFYACSAMPGWSRINDDAHYLSQVWLGWWMAYLACEAVNTTQKEHQSFQIMPVVSPGMTGLSFVYQR